MTALAPDVAHHAALDARMVIVARDIKLLSLASWPAGREIDFCADYARGEGWQGMDLPYNQGFLMRLVLPDEGSPVLDEAGLAAVNRAMAAADPAMVSLGLPKWEHEYTQNLIPVLRDTGLAMLVWGIAVPLALVLG